MCVWTFLPLVAWTSKPVWVVRAIWNGVTNTDREKDEEREKIERGEASDCMRAWLRAVDWWREALHTHLEQLEQLHLKRRASLQTLYRHFLFLPCALFFLLLEYLNLSLSGSLRLPECWNGYPLSISNKERVNRSKREGTRGHGKELFGMR